MNSRPELKQIIIDVDCLVDSTVFRIVAFELEDESGDIEIVDFEERNAFHSENLEEYLSPFTLNEKNVTFFMRDSWANLNLLCPSVKQLPKFKHKTDAIPGELDEKKKKEVMNYVKRRLGQYPKLNPTN